MLGEELDEEFDYAIQDGDAKRLAGLLRKLPRLDDDLRDIFADVLGSGTFARKFYLHRLKLVPRLKHKPKPPSPDSFIQSIFKGDTQQLVATLVGSTEFEADKIGVLADLLDVQAVGHAAYPYRLEFGRWGKGKPVDFLKTKARSFTRALMFQKELKTEKKSYLAMENVTTSTGWVHSTIMDDLAKVRKSRRRQLLKGE